MEILFFALHSKIFVAISEGTGLHTTTVKNNGNQGIIPTADVPQRTIVVDITKPPKSGNWFNDKKL